MRIMIDTNVLISMFLFPSATMMTLIDTLIDKHTIVLSSYIIDELKEVMAKKFPSKQDLVDQFIEVLPYEHFSISMNIDHGAYPFVRDPKDLPILVSAIRAQVDILLTGEKDFFEIDISKPIIMEPAKFVEYYS